MIHDTGKKIMQQQPIISDTAQQKYMIIILQQLELLYLNSQQKPIQIFQIKAGI